ncbi:hypothetical protein EDD85DRAFT_507646 [Armillaria nabsnona]|nr:hypothetical protein EDD85DRAFT_507646 [Armillaria nabsnona]
MSLQGGFTSYLGDLGFEYTKVADLDKTIEISQLHGIYTGIVSVALWNIFINKSRSIGGAMVVIIILLYFTTTTNVFFNGPFLTATRVSAFFQDHVTGSLALVPSWGWTPRTEIGIVATAVLSTVVADCTMIWRCWMVWGRDCLTVLFPIICLVIGLTAKILEIVEANFLPGGNYVTALVVYLSCILATTLWCTILIVFRILTVTRGVNGRLGDYHHIIEVLVESSALHSVTLIIYIALEVSNNGASEYFDTLAVFTTGIAPTLLAGRVAAGHARPDDSWEGSIMSSLRFGTHPGPQADPETCSQENSIVDNDLEAQLNQVDKPEEIGAGKKI